jgi:mRNA deadenylase, exonuclease subunit and related nucleases
MQKQTNLLHQEIKEINQIQNSRHAFSVMQWNTLARCCAIPAHHPKASQEHLNFEYRKELIAQEIRSYQADIICLEEVDSRDLEFFQ